MAPPERSPRRAAWHQRRGAASPPCGSGSIRPTTRTLSSATGRPRAPPQRDCSSHRPHDVPSLVATPAATRSVLALVCPAPWRACPCPFRQRALWWGATRTHRSATMTVAQVVPFPHPSHVARTESPSAPILQDVSPARPSPPRLLDQVRDTIRSRHYSRRTEKSYVAWIRRYILFHRKRHPREMGATEVTQFLSSLVVDKNVAASTQNQALSAILFLYRDVLEQDLPWLDDIVRSKRPGRLPVVL